MTLEIQLSVTMAHYANSVTIARLLMTDRLA